MRYLLAPILALAVALAATFPAHAGEAAAGRYTEIVIAGEAAPNGVYDPSVEYGPDGVGWMAYSAVTAGRDGRVETRIARSDDHGRTWTRVAAVNDGSPVTARLPDGRTIAGRWWHEVPALVYDPGDPGREWKLFWHRYFTQLPHRSGDDRLFAFGWIAMRHAPAPTGPWSGEIPLIGAGPFPLPPYSTRLKIGDLHPDLGKYIVLTEPGALAHDGRLYLSLQAARTPALGAERHDIILIASDDHGATWHHVAILLTAEEAAGFGATRFTGSSLAEEDGRVFLLVTPAIAGEPLTGHRGTVIFEFGDIAAGRLRHGPGGRPLVIRRLEPTLSKGGQADYDAGNTAGGIVMPQFDLGNLPRAFRIFSTGVGIAGE